MEEADPITHVVCVRGDGKHVDKPVAEFFAARLPESDATRQAAVIWLRSGRADSRTMPLAILRVRRSSGATMEMLFVEVLREYDPESLQ